MHLKKRRELSLMLMLKEVLITDAVNLKDAVLQ